MGCWKGSFPKGLENTSAIGLEDQMYQGFSVTDSRNQSQYALFAREIKNSQQCGWLHGYYNDNLWEMKAGKRLLGYYSDDPWEMKVKFASETDSGR